MIQEIFQAFYYRTCIYSVYIFKYSAPYYITFIQISASFICVFFIFLAILSTAPKFKGALKKHT